MGLHDGRVAVITGAAGGIGREHALEFARQGAQGRRQRRRSGPGRRRRDHGRRWRGGGQQRRHLGLGRRRTVDRHRAGLVRRTPRPGQQRGHSARQDVREHGHRHVGRGDPGPPARDLRAHQTCGRLLAGTAQGRRPRVASAGDQHLVAVGPVRQSGAIQLRCGQGRDRVRSPSSSPTNSPGWGSPSTPSRRAR